MCADEEVDVLIHFQSFDDDYADFETKIQDLDRRLATIFCQAFDDCNSIESCAKVGAGGGGPRGGSARQHPVAAATALSGSRRCPCRVLE